MNEEKSDLAQVVRLALTKQTEDVRLFVARLVRKYRNIAPDLAEQLDLYLKAKPVRNGTPMRELPLSRPASPKVLPIDDESRLSLLKVSIDDLAREAPLLSSGIEEILGQFIEERRQSTRLQTLEGVVTRPSSR
ncbi:MAG: hypothetical protein LBK01_00910 [Burkholderiaceae bacterium]|nr:hypothetical protein [Burkholderiaceae bacterium]